jgi:hypothetical protein
MAMTTTTSKTKWSGPHVCRTWRLGGLHRIVRHEQQHGYECQHYLLGIRWVTFAIVPKLSLAKKRCEEAAENRA